MKNPITVWVKWLLHYYEIRKLYPRAKLGYHSFASHSVLGEYTTVYEYVNLTNCHIGDYTFFAGNDYFFNTTVGKFCSIAPGVRCGLGMHPTNTCVSTHPAFFSTACQAQVTFADKNHFLELLPVTIGNDVWIGANALILDGVRVGDGAIIAAGAVVAKDVPSYAVVGGVPAKVIKYRFSPEEIEFLNCFQWWNRDYAWIQNNWQLWHDIKLFRCQFDSQFIDGKAT